MALVEAGAGYGKSVLAEQFRAAVGAATAYVALGPPDDDSGLLIASLRSALRSAGLSDLLGATDVEEPAIWIERLLDALSDREEPVVLIIDDAHHLHSADVTALFARLAGGLVPPHRLLIAARKLPGALEQSSTLRQAVRLDSHALAFTPEEVRELLGARDRDGFDEGELRTLVDATQGWATALILATSTHRTHRTHRKHHEAAEHGPSAAPHPIASPMRMILAGMPGPDRDVLIQLGHLPYISRELVAEIAGRPAAFEQLIAYGAPLARTVSGWWELPGPVASYLAAQAPVADRTVLAAAGAYDREGDPLSAIRMLLAVGLDDHAAQFLAGLAPPRVEELGFGAVREIVELLSEPALAAYPRALLHLARLAETAHRAQLRAEVLRRARRMIGEGAAQAGGAADAALIRELDAEHARDLMWDERTRDEAAALAQAVVDRAAAGELIARARALDVLGRLRSWFSEVGPQPEAEELLEQSAMLARRAGMHTWAAQALIPLAMGLHFALCRYDRALDVLEAALADLPARNQYRVMVQTFRAEALIELGRFTEARACIGEIHEIGRWSREEWIVAYAWWNEINLASYLGDAARTAEATREVLRRPAGWFEQPSGVEFLVQAADWLDRVGEHERSAECLAHARDRMAGTEHHVRVYGAAVIARSGDPHEADAAIAALLGSTHLEPQERWPLLVLRTDCRRRRTPTSPGWGLIPPKSSHCSHRRWANIHRASGPGPFPKN